MNLDRLKQKLFWKPPSEHANGSASGIEDVRVGRKLHDVTLPGGAAFVNVKSISLSLAAEIHFIPKSTFVRSPGVLDWLLGILIGFFRRRFSSFDSVGNGCCLEKVPVVSED
jgi:hypothetical protein